METKDKVIREFKDNFWIIIWAFIVSISVVIGMAVIGILKILKLDVNPELSVIPVFIGIFALLLMFAALGPIIKWKILLDNIDN